MLAFVVVLAGCGGEPSSQSDEYCGLLGLLAGGGMVDDDGEMLLEGWDVNDKADAYRRVADLAPNDDLADVWNGVADLMALTPESIDGDVIDDFDAQNQGIEDRAQRCGVPANASL